MIIELTILTGTKRKLKCAVLLFNKNKEKEFKELFFGFGKIFALSEQKKAPRNPKFESSYANEIFFLSKKKFFFNEIEPVVWED